MTTPLDNPLAPFNKLSPSVYMQDPAGPQLTGQPLIFIAFWMNAPPRALAKYVLQYRRLVPSARIVFVRASSNDFIFQSGKRSQEKRVTPAVEALASATRANPVFVHCFSNGGLFSAVNLLQAFKSKTGQALPISFMIVDSAPGTANLSSAVRAFSFSLPRSWILRMIGKALLWVTLGSIFVLHAVTRSLDPISYASKVINEPSLLRAVNAANKPTRCYIYSDTDDLVDWKAVEKHASDSEACGWLVRREQFQGTAHVGHMRAAPDRYWAIIKDYLEHTVPA
ncbi:hypothetical protein N7495_007615 [Penicillium taxi]|uniref:uncharacterized protein n=1 Tax=Penicillium taxi TaxID=168475 RepID=UPI0025459259|nr:uncharacterized protein N7495_007615 [Penicillium taxi]KAJ5887574.1 hypothetical protein N7495_007615 [Penicillium taxi]